MAQIDMGLLLDGLQHQIRNALSEAVHEHIDESVDVNAFFETVKGGVKVGQCGGAKGSHLDPEKHVEECGARASGA